MSKVFDRIADAGGILHLSWLTVVAGLGQLPSVAVPALGSLQLLLYVWCLAVSGWLLARGRRIPATPQPAVPARAPV